MINTRSLRFRLATWYAVLLAATLLLLVTSIYLGLKRYLDWNLQRTLAAQCRAIGTELIPELPTKGSQWLASETVESYDPEVNGYFIRISGVNGQILYVSGSPKDYSFDPSFVPRPPIPAGNDSLRNVKMPDGHRLIIEEMVFTNPDGNRFLVESGVSYQRVDEVLHGLLVTFATLLPIIILLALAAGFWLMRQSLRPVDEITRRARGITSTNLSDRLPLFDTGDEIERLSTSLNEMIARLDTSFSHIARFTADASHELRTPLTILQLELEGIVQHHLLPPGLVEHIESALEETHRLSRIVENLLIISRLDFNAVSIDKSPLDLGDLVASTAEPMQLLAEEKSLLLRCEIASNVYVEGDPSHLKQLILNLIDNAIKYTPSGGQVTIEVAGGDRYAILEVADTGVGISSEALPHVFERFYRADKARSRNSGGAGLGLAIVRAICGAHNGEIRVLSSEGLGSRFHVELPLIAQNK